MYLLPHITPGLRGDHRILALGINNQNRTFIGQKVWNDLSCPFARPRWRDRQQMPVALVGNRICKILVPGLPKTNTIATKDVLTG